MGRERDDTRTNDRVIPTLRGEDGEVKGPDPSEWGAEEERMASPDSPADSLGPGIGEIHNEGTPEEVKGPGQQWEKNDQGEYVNR